METHLAGMFMVGTPDRLRSFRHYPAPTPIYGHNAKICGIEKKGYPHPAGASRIYCPTKSII